MLFLRQLAFSCFCVLALASCGNESDDSENQSSSDEKISDPSRDFGPGLSSQKPEPNSVSDNRDKSSDKSSGRTPAENSISQTPPNIDGGANKSNDPSIGGNVMIESGARNINNRATGDNALDSVSIGVVGEDRRDIMFGDTETIVTGGETTTVVDSGGVNFEDELGDIPYLNPEDIESIGRKVGSAMSEIGPGGSGPSVEGSVTFGDDVQSGDARVHIGKVDKETSKNLAGSNVLSEKGPVRSFLVGFEAPPPGYAAYGYLVMGGREPGKRPHRRQALLGLLCGFPLASNTIPPDGDRSRYSALFAFIKNEYKGDELSISRQIGQSPDNFLQHYNWGRARDVAEKLNLDPDGIYIAITNSRLLPPAWKQEDDLDTIFHVSQDLSELQPRLVYHYVNKLKEIVEDEAKANALASSAESDWISVTLETVGRFVLRSASLLAEARADGGGSDEGYDTCP